MNDYWNDPPEEPEPPKCPVDGCDGFGDHISTSLRGESALFECCDCGHRWEFAAPSDPDPSWEKNGDLEEIEDAIREEPQTCVHGHPAGDCDDCDHLGDLAYDAAREMRGR